MALQIAGTTALVTGANRGIGRALVEALLARGAARVYATARRPEALGDLVARYGERVDQLGKLLESYSFHSVLNRGFALVRDQDGQPVLAAAGLGVGDTLGIEFADGRVGAKVTEGTGTAPKPATPPRKREGGSGNQGSLL